MMPWVFHMRVHTGVLVMNLISNVCPWHVTTFPHVSNAWSPHIYHISNECPLHGCVLKIVSNAWRDTCAMHTQLVLQCTLHKMRTTYITSKAFDIMPFQSQSNAWLLCCAASSRGFSSRISYNSRNRYAKHLSTILHAYDMRTGMVLDIQ